MHEGLEMGVVQCMGVFYTYAGMIGLTESEWLQRAINVIIGIFRRFVLMANVAKSKTMSCHLGTIRTKISADDFSPRSKVEEGTYQ